MEGTIMIGKIVLSAVTAATLAPVAAGPPASAYGRSTVTLTASDNGHTVRVHRGTWINVLLQVNPQQSPSRSTWWNTVAESGRALSARPQTLMLVRGTTMGRFRAVARGEATLSSTRAVCPTVPGQPTCHSMQGWSVTVDVR
jgi:hypothetical protein